MFSPQALDLLFRDPAVAGERGRRIGRHLLPPAPEHGLVNVEIAGHRADTVPDGGDQAHGVELVLPREMPANRFHGHLPPGTWPELILVSTESGEVHATESTKAASRKSTRGSGAVSGRAAPAQTGLVAPPP